MNLVRAELLKIRTTSLWWILALVNIPLWGLSLLINYFSASAALQFSSTDTEGVPPDAAAQLEAAAQAPNIAASLYTTGQFMGVLLVMLLGAIMVTNEYFHQTATTTFLTSPRRTPVILAKLGAAVILGLVFWAVTTVLNLVVAPLLLRALDTPALLGEPAIWRAVALNGLAYAIWAVLGVGAGVLIRSQIAATITLTMVYLGGFVAAIILYETLSSRFGAWFDTIQVLVPTNASSLIISGTELPGSPARWVGAVVLIGYAVVTGVVGTLIMKRRDIS
jgi:ABC-type transport system involved in multi-copper enzyme maturation permease subunit